MEVFQAIVNWLLVGGIIGMIYGIRKIILLERKIFSIEKNMNTLMGLIDKKEEKILQEEVKIGQKVGAKKQSKIKNKPFAVKK